jgi:V/A-type H+/Na+-transporting ATPase subunit F
VNFYCIADEETVRGFRLAGIAGQVVTTVQQAADAMDKAAAQPDYGIIIIAEKVASAIRTQVDEIRFERERPLIVEIPGPEGPLPGRRSLSDFVHEAVGIRIGENGVV